MKLEHIDRMINLEKNPQMLDMNFFSEYVAELGFRLGVEAIHNNKDNAFFSVVASVCPGATFYDVNRQGPPMDVL